MYVVKKKNQWIIIFHASISYYFKDKIKTSLKKEETMKIIIYNINIQDNPT